MFWGLVLILIGLAMFADNLGLVKADFWEYFWPIILIAIGGSMISKRPHKPTQEDQ